MRKLTDIQKEFILQNFFRNNDYAGWKNVATKLLDTGTCIVAGKECIWIGGVGNFIKTKDSSIAVGCLQYDFDLEYFISAEWFKSIKCGRLLELAEKKKQINDDIFDINNL